MKYLTRVIVYLGALALLGASLATGLWAGTAGGAPPGEPPAAPEADLAPAATKVFHVEGGGWGHGVGMSQYGAYGRAQRGQTAEQILGFYYQGAQVQAFPVASGIRVWMAETSSAGGVVLTAGTIPMTVTSGRGLIGTIPAGVGTRITAVNGVLRIADSPAPGIDRFWVDLDPAHPIVVSPPSIHVNRGRAEVILLPGNALRVVISNLTMQDYLYGLSEVPSSWPAEALRAQAIAARSYASYRISSGGLDNPDCSCSLYGNQGDQVYGAYEKEGGSFGERWVAAVNATDGLVATSGGQPIQAFYSSSNGGYTEASEDGFVTALPYLRANPDPDDAAGPDFRWSRDYSQADLSRWLAARSDTNVGTVERVEVLAPLTKSGRAGRALADGTGGVRITGSAGVKRVSGARFQAVVNIGVAADGLGLNKSLKSTLFSFDGFTPYDAAFRGGVLVASARLDGNPRIVTAAGPGGGPDVSIFDATSKLLRSFYAYDAGFRGGVSVAACDLDGDGNDEIVTGAGPGGGPDVSIFDGSGVRRRSFYAYDAGFRGGVFVACGDVDADGRAEIVTGAGPGGGPDVSIFDGTGARRRSFFAYDAGFRGGVRVGATSGRVVTGPGPGGGPDVGVFDSVGTPLAHFMAYDPAFAGGIYVAAGDVRGDSAPEVVVGPGEGGGPHVAVLSLTGARQADLLVFTTITDRGARVAVGPFPQGRLLVGSGTQARPTVNVLAV